MDVSKRPRLLNPFARRTPPRASLVAVALLALALPACGPGGGAGTLTVSPALALGEPTNAIEAPASNPGSAAKVALGRDLFYDRSSPAMDLSRLRVQLDLPAEPVELDEFFGAEPAAGHGREEDDVVRRLQHLGRDLGLLVFVVEALARLRGLIGKQHLVQAAIP